MSQHVSTQLDDDSNETSIAFPAPLGYERNLCSTARRSVFIAGKHGSFNFLSMNRRSLSMNHASLDWDSPELRMFNKSDAFQSMVGRNDSLRSMIEQTTMTHSSLVPYNETAADVVGTTTLDVRTVIERLEHLEESQREDRSKQREHELKTEKRLEKLERCMEHIMETLEELRMMVPIDQSIEQPVETEVLFKGRNLLDCQSTQFTKFLWETISVLFSKSELQCNGILETEPKAPKRRLDPERVELFKRAVRAKFPVPAAEQVNQWRKAKLSVNAKCRSLCSPPKRSLTPESSSPKAITSRASTSSIASTMPDLSLDEHDEQLATLV